MFSKSLHKEVLFIEKRCALSLIIMCCFCVFSFSQVTYKVDTTSIRIGEQIKYKIEVEADSTKLVVFPEGQTFMPLELVEVLDIDTTKKKSKYKLLREYYLTQFDSGGYTIPRQKIIIGDKPFYTDSLRVEVGTVAVDTTKQGLYDIKPIIQVEKSTSKTWLLILGILLGIALVAFLLYWFIWRKKPLTEEEEIALLPPYDRAKLALQKLDESNHLQNYEMKAYYSELTFIIRKYLDEKVYDRALESTTDELVSRLNLLKDGNQIELSKDDIKNIETILKRADLVKFAKSAPDVALAEIDRNTIDLEIDQVKQALPEPSEEEKLLDKQYREAQERKKKRKKIVLTIALSIFVIMATLVGFGIKYGFNYVKDTIIGHDSKELLEGDWVKSAYGFPPVNISTPKVLKRTEIELPDEMKDKVDMTTFIYGTLLDVFSIAVNTTNYKSQPNPNDEQKSEAKVDLLQASESSIAGMEAQGAKDITVKRDKFSTPNGAEGLKTFGTLSIQVPNTDIKYNAEYTMLHFNADNVLQQIIITWAEDDTYADEMVQRILDSIELKPNEEEGKK